MRDASKILPEPEIARALRNKSELETCYMMAMFLE